MERQGSLGLQTQRLPHHCCQTPPPEAHDLVLPQVVDKWFKSNDEESFTFARMLIAQEGLLCGEWLRALWVAAWRMLHDVCATYSKRMKVKDTLRLCDCSNFPSHPSIRPGLSFLSCLLVLGSLLGSPVETRA